MLFRLKVVLGTWNIANMLAPVTIASTSASGKGSQNWEHNCTYCRRWVSSTVASMNVSAMIDRELKCLPSKVEQFTWHASGFVVASSIRGREGKGRRDLLVSHGGYFSRYVIC